MDAEGDSETEVHTGLKLIARSSIIVFIGIFLSKVFLFLYKLIIAKYYDAAVLGVFSLAIMLIGWFRLVSDLGIRQGLLRYISLFRGNNQENKIPIIFKKSFFYSNTYKHLGRIYIILSF